MLNPHAMRQWPLDKRVKYVNALRKAVAHRCPKNKLGAPLVSDFDLLCADEEEIKRALWEVEEGLR